MLLARDLSVPKAYAEIASSDAETRILLEPGQDLGEVRWPQLQISVQLHYHVIWYVDQFQAPSERAELRGRRKTISFGRAAWPSSRSRVIVRVRKCASQLVGAVVGPVVDQDEPIRRPCLSVEGLQEDGQVLPLVEKRDDHGKHDPRINPFRRSGRLIASLFDPRPYFHLFRLLHYWNYSHVSPRRKAELGPGILMAPTVSFRNGERIKIGARAHIGEYCSLWAGDHGGRIVIGEDALFGPNVYITASNYDYTSGAPVWRQRKVEQDVVIGADVWLGAGVIVLPGVTVGEGCIVAAGSVVTGDLPPRAVAAGVPARVLKMRDGSPPPSLR